MHFNVTVVQLKSEFWNICKSIVDLAYIDNFYLLCYNITMKNNTLVLNILKKNSKGLTAYQILDVSKI